MTHSRTTPDVLAFWPLGKTLKRRERGEKIERQQFSPQLDTSAELWPDFQVTLCFDQ